MAAVELRVFSVIGESAKTSAELTETIGLHRRGAADFLDALVALGLLRRRAGAYSNTADAAAFLDERSPLYVGGAIRMADERLYAFWSHLTDALLTGRPQNELADGDDQFAAIYVDPARVKLFADAMTAVSVGPAIHLARSFPWASYRTMADIGAAAGIVPAVVAASHAHLRSYGLDLPALAPMFEETAKRYSVESRVTFVSADLFTDNWPEAEVYILGHMLHNFDLERRRFVVSRAFDLLPPGGKLIVYDAMIDEHRRANPIGLLMSLNMLIETPAGSDYTVNEARELLASAGFRSVIDAPLSGFDVMVIGRKPGITRGGSS